MTTQSFPSGLADLMDAYVDGDDRAFSALYERLVPSLRAQIRGKIADRHVAEELVQVVFMKGHSARFRFVPGSDQPGEKAGQRDRAVVVWYAAIARNATIDYLRRLYRERAVRSDHMVGRGADRADLLERIGDSAPGIEAVALENERQATLRAHVRAAVESLPHSQREVVRMHKLQGKTMADIGRSIGVREGTLRVRAHRGYKALAHMLGGFQAAAAA